MLRCVRHPASSDQRAYWSLFGPSAAQNASFHFDVATFLASDPAAKKYVGNEVTTVDGSGLRYEPGE